jgi:4-amino-4-deoxy-L-arabinose transferase-like glycosyltransferase
MDRHHPPHPTTATRARTLAVIALALAAFLISLAFFSIFASTVQPGCAQEYKYIHAALIMIERGDYIVPIEYGRPRLEKPPLSYWLTVGAVKILGARLFAYRLPSVLACSLTVVIVALLGALVFEWRVGLLAALILAGSSAFYLFGISTLPDGPLIFCVTGSLAALTWHAYRPAKYSWAPLALAWLFIALGLLAKGPIALIIPLGALVWVRLRTKQWLLTRSQLLPGAALALLPLLLWTALVWTRLGDTAVQMVKDELLLHSTGKTEGGFFERFDYVKGLVRGFFPWSSLLIVGALAGWRARTQNVPADQSPSLRHEQRIVTTLLWGWMLATFLSFFVFFGYYVRMRLVLPMLPPLALLSARAFVGWLQRNERPRLVWGFRLTGALILVPSALALLFMLDARARHAFPASLWAAAAVLCALGVALQLRPLARNPWPTLVGLSLVWMAACCVLALGDVIGGRYAYSAPILRRSAQAFAAAHRPGRRYYFFDENAEDSKARRALAVAANVRIEPVDDPKRLPRPDAQTALICFDAVFQSLPASQRALWKPTATVPYWAERGKSTISSNLVRHWSDRDAVQFNLDRTHLLVLESQRP